MPSFDDPRDQFAPSLMHPVSEVLARYLAMTAPARTPRPTPAPGADRSAAVRAEELWDALGDFA